MGFIDILKEGCTVIAQNSPLVFMVIVVIVYSYLMYKHGVKTMQMLYDRAMDNIYLQNKDSIEQMRKTIQTLNELSQC